MRKILLLLGVLMTACGGSDGGDESSGGSAGTAGEPATGGAMATGGTPATGGTVSGTGGTDPNDCRESGDSCSDDATSCCAGTTCVVDVRMPTNGTCSALCNGPGDCVSGCCTPVVDTTYSACAPPEYCACADAGQACNVHGDCCAGHGCISGACAFLCATNAECQSGCCAPLVGGGGACGPASLCL